MRKKVLFAGALVCLLISNIATAQSPAMSGESSNASRNASTLTHIEISKKIAEAKSLLKAQPKSSDAGSGGSVKLAAFDSVTSQIHIFPVAKDTFLTFGAETQARTQLGRAVRVRVLNPNGVNTAVQVADAATGQKFLPLVVEYPIVKSGVVTENAYYTSAHPALRSPDVISAGQSYVTTMLDQAAAELAQDGLVISSDLVNVARHLVIVEHTDHKRFKEQDPAVYPEVLSLYALNRGDTYRYSVSSAGAGGMIQMIPRTYEAMRQHHPNISLQPDFVTGMRNHANALKAMLLYIDDTWKFLAASAEVQQALQSGTATKTELLAAGYNSNPYRLPGYLSNGGSAWRTLIPAETQMYLKIYRSVDNNLDFPTTPTETPVDANEPGEAFAGTAVVRQAGAALMSWMSKQVLQTSAAALNQLVP